MSSRNRDDMFIKKHTFWYLLFENHFQTFWADFQMIRVLPFAKFRRKSTIFIHNAPHQKCRLKMALLFRWSQNGTNYLYVLSVLKKFFTNWRAQRGKFFNIPILCVDTIESPDRGILCVDEIWSRPSNLRIMLFILVSEIVLWSIPRPEMKV